MAANRIPRESDGLVRGGYVYKACTNSIFKNIWQPRYLVLRIVDGCGVLEYYTEDTELSPQPQSGHQRMPSFGRRSALPPLPIINPPSTGSVESDRVNLVQATVPKTMIQKPAKVIPLRRYTRCELLSASNDKDPTFTIFSVDETLQGQARTYNFMAGSMGDAHKWVETIKPFLAVTLEDANDC